MGVIHVQEFTGGLDARRMPEATSGGVLMRARNGHITRGGEFDQRAAFVPEYALPAGTVGMFYNTAGIVVFGSDVEPGGLPTGVSYQRLQHSDNTTDLVRVLSADLYAGKIYAVGEFADGAIFHYYDGARVTDWFDGRARASFTITDGGVIPAAAATGSFDVTGGTSGGGNQITAVAVDGVDVLGMAVSHTGDNDTTATAVAAQINSYVSSPDYAAAAVGPTVTITAAVTGPAANGRVVATTVSGDVTTGNVSSMAGGANSVTSQMTDITVDGVSIIAAPVVWATSHSATAAAIASAINSHTSSPDYTATVNGETVSIAAATPGAGPNGDAVVFDVANGLVVDPSSTVMADGATSDDLQPGTFVKTIGQKMHSVSGPLYHFSGIKEPTQWTTDAVGAGFIDLSSESSGSEKLTALARYMNFVAVFAERAVQIWYSDPDPALNRQTQVLNNTGTASPLSVTPFGDTDLFYLDESGLRSLRARDSSNSAATTDIGVPVDDLITAKLETLNEFERARVTGLIEPRNGRFWLIMKDQIFVFSFFNGAKVSAWSTYDTTWQNDGEAIPFEVDAAVVFRRRVYLRSGDTIFVYGGLATGAEHDDTEAEAWLPYLDANDPSRKKELTGIDVAMRGLWEVSAAMMPTNPAAEDKIGVFSETTYDLDGRMPMAHQASHISLRFRSRGVGPHRLGACLVHYRGHDDED